MQPIHRFKFDQLLYTIRLTDIPNSFFCHLTSQSNNHHQHVLLVTISFFLCLYETTDNINKINMQNIHIRNDFYNRYNRMQATMDIVM